MEIQLTKKKVNLVNARILTNDVILPNEFNPHNVRLWVIGNEFGSIGAVWATNSNEALDVLVDAGLGETFLIGDAPKDENDDLAYLGNAGERADLQYAWLEAVDIKKQSYSFIEKLVEARAKGRDDLNF